MTGRVRLLAPAMAALVMAGPVAAAGARASEITAAGVLGRTGAAQVAPRVPASVQRGTARQRVDAPTARRWARAILRDGRFHAAPIPRPLHGVLRRLGEWLAPIGRAFASGFRWLAARLPGGNATVWTLLAITVLLVAGGLTARFIRRRPRAAQAQDARLGRWGEAATEDPDVLERAAEEAERAGELDRAVRLRFRAGLLRLDAHKRIELRPSLTTGELARRISSPAFDGLARTFDEVTYGRRRAAPADVQSARSQWTRILEEAAA